MSNLEPASFEVERFELSSDACLEVRGRWFGVRGRRFMRPTLTAVADGREHRSLAVLDHKPWIAQEGEAWLAAFPCSTDPAALVGAELTVAPDVTVPLPAPSGPSAPRRERAGASRTRALSELAAARRDCDRLRAEVAEALAAAGLAAQTARERDAARTHGAQAIRERDEAHAERDASRRDRNRMLAERDTARTRLAQATRQWETTAALGARRTHERDAPIERRQALRGHDLALTEPARPSASITDRPIVAPRPRRPPAPAATPHRDRPGSREAPIPTAQPVRPRDAAAMWRTRLVVGAALLVALLALIVMLAAR